jgi:hypothetical protein
MVVLYTNLIYRHVSFVQSVRAGLTGMKSFIIFLLAGLTIAVLIDVARLEGNEKEAERHFQKVISVDPSLKNEIEMLTTKLRR